jgi:glutaconate CoA-transferase subunit A
VPYLPTRSLLGSDILARNPAPRGAVSFTGVPLVLVPALQPDVAILHVQRGRRRELPCVGADGVSAAAGKASRAVIVVAEELVEPAVIHSDPNRTFLPGFLVTAVVHLPGGAHPSPSRATTTATTPSMRTGTDARSPRKARPPGSEWVRGPGSCRLHGEARRRALRAAPAPDPQLAAPVDYGC